MGVYQYPGKNGARKWRMTIGRNGERFEEWFTTEQEAVDRWNQLENEYDQRLGKREHIRGAGYEALRARARALYASRDTRNRAEFPCGMAVRVGVQRFSNSRCGPMDACQHYDDCLTEAMKRNWPGWRIENVKKP